MQQNHAVFLDRDGVLNRSFTRNHKPYAPQKLEDFIIYSQAKSITASLKQAGYLVIVVTNQPDVGNGLVDKATVESMHKQLMREIVLDAIKVCYHRQVDNCACRKPKPGMLLEAASELNIDLGQSIMIGDRHSDVEAGIKVGCKTVFIDYHYDEVSKLKPDVTISSVDEIIEAVLNLKEKG